MAPGPDEMDIDVGEISKIIESPTPTDLECEEMNKQPILSESNDETPAEVERMETAESLQPIRPITSDSNEEDHLTGSSHMQSSPSNTTQSTHIKSILDDETDSEETSEIPSTVKNSKSKNVISSDEEDEPLLSVSASSKKKIIFSDSEEDLADLSQSQPQSQPIKLKSKAKKIFSDEESGSEKNADDNDLLDIQPSPISKASPSKKSFSSSDSEEDKAIKSPKSQKSKKSSRIKDMASSSEDEDLPDIHPLNKSSIPTAEPPESQPFPNRVLDPDIFGNNSESDDGGRRGYSSDRDPQNENDSAGSGGHTEKINKKKKGKEDMKKVPKRKASEQARAKTMQELTSKTQQMVRESRVSLPYHRPKQLTLDEFIRKRNKARAPVLTSLINSSALRGMRNTISMVEDVLPIMANMADDPEPEPEMKVMIPEIGNCKIILDKIDCIDTIDVPENNGNGLDIEYETEQNSEVCNTSNQADEAEGENDIMMSSDAAEDPKKDVANLTEIIDEIKIDEKCKNKEDIPCEKLSPIVVTDLPDIISTVLESIVDAAVAKIDNVDISLDDVSVAEQKQTESNELMPQTIEQPNPITQCPSESITSFQKEEAELNAFLTAKNPRPKKKTVAELLKNMPGFDKIANLKPKLGGNSDPKALIDFGDTRKSDKHKNSKALQTLMDRFVWHAVAASEISPQKDQHTKLHIRKTEKDSQGQLHSTVDEIDYVTPAPTEEEEEDALAKCNRRSGLSPQEAVPGQKMTRLKEALRESIWSRKAKEYKERMKMHAMYDEERELEDKVSEDELPDDEEVDDEEIELSDSEEEEELELDDMPLVDKVRKRLRYVEDEAEDDDADEEDSDDDEDESAKSDISEANDHDVDLEGDLEEHFPLRQTAKQQQDKFEDLEDQDMTDEPIDNRSDVNRTPVISADSVFNQKSSSDFWTNTRDIAPLSPKVNAGAPGTKNDISDSIAKLISSNMESSEDLAELCSGQFPSQAPATPYETQTCFGFDLDDSDDDQALSQACDNALGADSQSQSQPQDSQVVNSPVGATISSALLSTPSGSCQVPKTLAINADTPKTSDRRSPLHISLGKRFEMEAQKMNEELKDFNSTQTVVERVSKTKLDFRDLSTNETEEDIVDTKSNDEIDREPLDSDDEEDIGVKVVKKRKKLTFSDDEDDEIENSQNLDEELEEIESDVSEEETLEEPGEDYEDEEGELERKLVLQAEKKPVRKGLFGSDGRLKKKFLENEAELSGEEGSEDEDERGLNIYEEEDGDEEDIDEEAVKREVEKAHLKHLLDKDDRDIRLLQEEYLERGDLEGGNLRERKFRWNNIDDAFTDKLVSMGDSDGDYEEDEEEVKRKLAEIERRKWINEHSEIFEAAEEESQRVIFEQSRFLKLGRSTIKKIDSFVENSSSFLLNETSNSVPDASITSLVNSNIKIGAKMFFSKNKPNTELDDGDDPFIFNKTISQPLFASPDEPISKMKRGSFLSRGSPTLNRLAEMNKVNENPTGTNVKSNSRNFVFATVAPPEQASKNTGSKRQANSQAVGQPKKMPRMDRSFSNLDASSKDASIFKWM